MGNVDAQSMLWSVCAVETVFEWKGYETELDRYRYEQICEELKSCIDVALENELFGLLAKWIKSCVYWIDINECGCVFVIVGGINGYHEYDSLTRKVRTILETQSCNLNR